jgi:hypothetical protein
LKDVFVFVAGRKAVIVFVNRIKDVLVVGRKAVFVNRKGDVLVSGAMTCSCPEQ